MPLTPGRPDPVPAGSGIGAAEAEGRCTSVTQVSGSSRVARRPVSVGAVAALSCCTFPGSSSQRPIVCKMRLCCRYRSSTLRSAAVVGAGRRSGAVWRGRSRPVALLYLGAVRIPAPPPRLCGLSPPISLPARSALTLSSRSPRPCQALLSPADSLRGRAVRVEALAGSSGG